jgi:hypothetical protein
MKRFILMSMLALVTGCSPVSLDDYRSTTPNLDLKTFFDGKLLVHGMLQDRSGKVTRRFTATIDAHWDGETGILEEHFIFDDGEEQDRVWQLNHLGDGRYTGTAGDVVGIAEGRLSGSVFRWRYKLDVPYGKGSIVVNMDDWLYLVDEDHLMNKTRLSKFGFTVGELTIMIRKSS